MEKEPLLPHQIRLATTMHEKATQQAQQRGLNFSAYVRNLIAADLKQQNELRR